MSYWERRKALTLLTPEERRSKWDITIFEFLRGHDDVSIVQFLESRGRIIRREYSRIMDKRSVRKNVRQELFNKRVKYG